MTVTPARSVIPILLYHSLSAEATDAYRQYCIDPGRFREQMEAIAATGLRTVTISELTRLLASPEPNNPDRLLAITFDDGFEEVHRIALPILADLGLRASTFVVTRFVGKTSRWLDPIGEGDRALLAWTQIAELAASGFEIGSHSHSHPQLDTLGLSEVSNEVHHSRVLLEEQLQRPITSFAYPHGYHTSQIKSIVGHVGYTGACGVKHALSHVSDDPFALGRVVVSDTTSNDQFASWLEGRNLHCPGPENAGKPSPGEPRVGSVPG